jgi:hypothetical protein
MRTAPPHEDGVHTRLRFCDRYLIRRNRESFDIVDMVPTMPVICAVFISTEPQDELAIWVSKMTVEEKLEVFGADRR